VAGAGGICTTELACDADFEYFQSYGSSVPNVENRINFIINTVNLQYESQTSITHAITAIVVRSNSSDPYTSNDSGTLLTQFRNEWLNNQGGIQRDVAKLFTARSINGGIIGQAWTIGAICVTNSHYCYSWSDCCGSTACATDLAAHELGHLWNAVHCSCPSNTMNPFITCMNNFSAQSIAAIIGHRDSRTCLDGDCSGGGPEPPGNDDCANAAPVTNGTIGFTNIAATTDGPNEPGSCNFFSYTHIDSDVWYRYTATCNGTATVSLCGSGYDTKMAVYGTTCPASSGLALACNDDSSCGLQSQVSFAATAGSQYLIRIGGYNGAQGNGSMTISCGGGGGPPANDNCANALPVLEGDIAFTNINANTDGPSLPGSCDEGNGLSFQSDVWYVYEPVGNGTLTVSTCSQAAFDTRLAAYTGTCTGLVLAACNDDGAGCSDLTSLMDVPVACDEPVLIRVGSFGAAQGNGTLSLTFAGSDCGPGAPPNDDCANAIVATDGTTPFTTTDATTDGPDEPALCDSAGFTQVDLDIWYKYVASCDGNLTVSLCGSTYDTKLAVYAGGCPIGDGTAIACNDDSCDLQSELVVAVTAGQQYRIRVGGFLGSSGDGTLSISCDTPSTCVGDTNGDLEVDVDDLTAVILGWGSCPGCPADLNGDDMVNVDDLTLIILNWGPCEP
jgi:hypothetical protein